MNEVEKMYKLAKVAKPVIKKWYYDGYYEDFSWESSEEDCTKLLKYFDNSIDKLNDRIQQMKKEENTKYDRYTDSVDTEFGRIEKAYIDYPPFTAEKQLKLIEFMLKKYGEETIGFELWKDNSYHAMCHLGYDGFENYADSNTLCGAIAGLITLYWQDLTEEERKQIKNILESEVRE